MINVEAVIFDYGRTLYDPSTDDLFPHAHEVLKVLKEMNIGVGLVSIALTENLEERLADLRRLEIERFFDEVEIVPRSGDKDFVSILGKLNVSPSQSMVVGDNLKREITAGNRIGAFTVWTKERLAGEFTPQNDLQTPKVTIYQIRELISLVEAV